MLILHQTWIVKIRQPQADSWVFRVAEPNLQSFIEVLIFNHMEFEVAREQLPEGAAEINQEVGVQIHADYIGA